MTGYVTTGVVAFSNLDEHEVYRGQSTGRFSLVVTMDENEASKLEDMGIKIKEYKDKKQRKFTSKFKVDVLDLNGDPVPGEIPYGSVVRLLWKEGDPHPEHGVPTYLNKVRLVEVAEHDMADTPPEF